VLREHNVRRPLGRTPRWHPFIRRALDAAETDVFGQTKPEAATALRRRLR
jgi:hypothetical protein